MSQIIVCQGSLMKFDSQILLSVIENQLSLTILLLPSVVKKCLFLKDESSILMVPAVLKNKKFLNLFKLFAKTYPH
jgi:hypothetical protein